MQAFDPTDHLDASLTDFEAHSPPPFGYGSRHSGFAASSSESESEMDEPADVSAGGYSPPAWRHLKNGDRSSGFWYKGDNLLGYGRPPPPPPPFSREGSLDIDDDDVLAAAMRTRLPTGSVSPEKERSPEPEYANQGRVKIEEPNQEELRATLAGLPPKDASENCSSMRPEVSRVTGYRLTMLQISDSPFGRKCNSVQSP